MRSRHATPILQFCMWEKVRLPSIKFSTLKVAQTHPNQPIALLWTEFHSLPKTQRDVCQFFAGAGR